MGCAVDSKSQMPLCQVKTPPKYWSKEDCRMTPSRVVRGSTCPCSLCTAQSDSTWGPLAGTHRGPSHFLSLPRRQRCRRRRRLPLVFFFSSATWPHGSNQQDKHVFAFTATFHICDSTRWTHIVHCPIYAEPPGYQRKHHETCMWLQVTAETIIIRGRPACSVMYGAQ